MTSVSFIAVGASLPPQSQKESLPKCPSANNNRGCAYSKEIRPKQREATQNNQGRGIEEHAGDSHHQHESKVIHSEVRRILFQPTRGLQGRANSWLLASCLAASILRARGNWRTSAKFVGLENAVRSTSSPQGFLCSNDTISTVFKARGMLPTHAESAMVADWLLKSVPSGLSLL